MNAYEAKIERRRERLEARAARLAAEGQSRIARARQISDGIPFGQPILVGHHSEGRHRADLKRIQGGFSKGYEALAASEAVAKRAENLGQHGISSDDPEAVIKLRAKLAGLESAQEKMKAANAVIRKAKGSAAAIPALVALGFSEAKAANLLEADFCGRVGFPSYAISNNGAEIRRCQERIKVLEANAQRAPAPVVEVGGVQMVENVEENRLQLIFPGKPEAAMRAQLKGHGFRWAPSAGAWQRQLSNAARYAASQILKG